MHQQDDEASQTPSAVVGAVAAGTTPLPFLAVYATMFIVHGGFHHVVPPDIGNSNRIELLVGLGCLAGFVIGAIAIVWLLNRHRRWPFVLIELALLGLAIDFLTDDTKGGRPVSGLVAVASLLALVLAAHPQTWEHLGQRCPGPLARLFGRRPEPRAAMPAGSMPTSDTTPRSARFVGRRRRTQPAPQGDAGEPASEGETLSERSG